MCRISSPKGAQSSAPVYAFPRLTISACGSRKNIGRSLKNCSCWTTRVFAHQHERSPLTGMGIAFAKLKHRLAQRVRLVFALCQLLVEGSHEIGRALIVDIPQAQQ